MFINAYIQRNIQIITVCLCISSYKIKFIDLAQDSLNLFANNRAQDGTLGDDKKEIGKLLYDKFKII